MSSPPAEAPRDLRDRFLAFAFAANDLLVEADGGGRVTFAAGAFRTRLGEAPEAFLGRPVHALVAPEDRTALGLAISGLAASGRLPPTAFRLNDARRSHVTVAGLAPPGPSARLFLTFGPRPAAPPKTGPVAPESLALQAEARLREGGGGTLGLLELPGATDDAFARAPGLRAALLEGSAICGRTRPRPLRRADRG